MLEVDLIKLALRKLMHVTLRRKICRAFYNFI